MADHLQDVARLINDPTSTLMYGTTLSRKNRVGFGVGGIIAEKALIHRRMIVSLPDGLK